MFDHEGGKRLAEKLAEVERTKNVLTGIEQKTSSKFFLPKICD